MKIANKSNYPIIIFHVSKAKKNKFCYETKYLENLKNLIGIRYFAFKIIYELMCASSKDFAKL